MPLHLPAGNNCSASLSLGVQSAFDILIAIRYLHSVSPVDTSNYILIYEYLPPCACPSSHSLPPVEQSPAGEG